MTLTKIKELDTDKILNYLIVAYALLIPVSRAGIGILSALIIIVWLFKKDIKEDFKHIIQNKFTLLLLVFILYS